MQPVGSKIERKADVAGLVVPSKVAFVPHKRTGNVWKYFFVSHRFCMCV